MTNLQVKSSKTSHSNYFIGLHEVTWVVVLLAKQCGILNKNLNTSDYLPTVHYEN